MLFQINSFQISEMKLIYRMLASTCFLYLYPKNVPCQWQKLHIVLIIIIPALPSGSKQIHIIKLKHASGLTHALILYFNMYYSPSHSLIQRADEASEGIRQSPRGDRHTEPTLGPSGRHDRLNCWAKKRRKKTVNQCFIVIRS